MVPCGVGLDAKVDGEIGRFEEKQARALVQRADPRGDPPPHPKGPDASAAIRRVPEHRRLLLDRERFPP